MDEKTIEFNKSEFIKKLEQLRELEIQKPVKNIDTDFIDDIVSLGLELKGLNAELTPEEVEEKVRKIPFVEKTTTLNTPPTSVKGRATKVKSNKILLIAAIISILVAIFTISSIAFDWNIFDELKNRFGTVFNTPINQEMVIDGVTVVSRGENIVCDSVEDAMNLVNEEVLYPSKLPDDIIVEQIVLDNINGKDRVIFNFNNRKFTYTIEFNVNITDSIKDVSTEILKINELNCYIIDMPDLGQTQVCFECNENLYTVNYNNKQDLIEIIENLKELQ